MIYLLCRNRVRDFSQWRNVFTSNTSAAQDAGLRLIKMWRGVEEPENVFFMFEADDIGRAKDFMNAPESAEAGEEAGVIDGEYHFVEEVASH